MVILLAKFSQLSKAWSSLAYSTGSSFTYSSPGPTQGRNTSKWTTINHGTMHKQHDAIHVMICGMSCNAYACSRRKKDEQGINLANQVCRWKDEMILVEIDIRITGSGYTVCKRQARQDMIGNAWTWPQLGNPSVPLERWDEIAWKWYKERRNRSYDLQMASDSKMTPVCDLQQVGI